MALAGAAGGFIIFLVLNPSILREETVGMDARDSFDALTQIFLGALWLGLAIGSTIGASLVTAEELQTPKAKRAVFFGLAASLTGALIGSVGSVAAQFMYMLLCLISQICARTIGWAIIGLAAGICPGAVRRSYERVKMGAIGGIIGGGLGGMLFDGIAEITRGGSASRFVGFIIMGAAIGAGVSLVEEFKKEYWLTMLSGAREGRSFILTKPETNIGRDELVDIPLFGDQSVQKRHASIVTNKGSAQILATPGQMVEINSRPMPTASLSDGDIISIGRHRLRFNSRHTTGVFAPLAPYPLQHVQQAAMQSQTGVPRLEVVAGPHTGEVFTLASSPIIVGRDAACNIPLFRDGMASRQHAKIFWDGSVWRVEDLGSTNGLFVNQQRVANHILKPGDTIVIGQTVFTAL